MDLPLNQFELFLFERTLLRLRSAGSTAGVDVGLLLALLRISRCTPFYSAFPLLADDGDSDAVTPDAVQLVCKSEEESKEVCGVGVVL